MRYWPYLCRSTALPAYLSFGFTTGATILPIAATVSITASHSIKVGRLTRSWSVAHVLWSILCHLGHCLLPPCARCSEASLSASWHLRSCTPRLPRANLQRCSCCRHCGRVKLKYWPDVALLLMRSIGEASCGRTKSASKEAKILAADAIAQLEN